MASHLPVACFPVRQLQSLLESVQDAERAYLSAIERLGNEGLQRRLIRLRGDHQRYLIEVARAVRGLGAVPRSVSWPGPFQKSVKQADGDVGIVAALDANLARMLAHCRHLSVVVPDAELRGLCLRGVKINRAHHAWAMRSLRRMRIPRVFRPAADLRDPGESGRMAAA